MLSQDTQYPFVIKPISIKEEFHKIIYASKQLLNCSKSIAFHGVSHKSLTIANICMQLYPNINLYLFDGVQAKINKYWGNIQLKKYGDDMASSDTIHIISFGGKNALNLESSLPYEAKTLFQDNIF